MNPAQLLAHFDRLADAPDAIPRLRRFILDLAVRGKLVDQDPKDEPASQLLKRIAAEKERLLKAGEIPKEKPVPPIEPGEAPFEVPATWKWVRIRQVTSDRGQTIPDKDFTYIDVTAINKEVGCVGDPKVVTASEAPSRARKLVRKGDVLYSCVRPYLLNTAVIASEIVPAPIASTAFAVLNSFGLILSKYIWIVLRSPFMVVCVEAKMRGQAYPAINDSDFALLPLPVPPLTEQHRIVTKVDELMALCDQLQAAQSERESRRDQLAAASLQRLNEPANATAFHEHVRFHLQHLPRLTTRPDHIQQLRQAILNLAVRGKLVEQDSKDEPASDLLKRIREEQNELLHARSLKRNESHARIQEEAPHFVVPETWQWTRLGSIIVFGPQNGISPKPSARPDAPKAVTLTATTKSAFDPRHFKQVEANIPQDSDYWLRPGDLLFQRGNTREYVGIAAYYTGQPGLLLYPDLMIKVRISDNVSLHFVHLCAVAPYARAYFAKHASGAQASMPKINHGTLVQLPIPLPPLAEQHRIVAKVEELLALCDHLEGQLNTTCTDGGRLLDAVLLEALTAGN